MTSFQGTWLANMNALRPGYTLENIPGGRTIAVLDSRDVGMYSVIQGGGYI